MNRLQIYTYQRAAEEISFNRRAKRRQANKHHLKLDLKQKISWIKDIDLLAIVKEWANVENLILVLCVLILSRAFVLHELLPFAFAYIAAFGQRDKKKLILLSFFAILGSFTVLKGPQLGINIITLVTLALTIYFIAIPKGKEWWGMPVLTMSIIMICKSILMLTGDVSLYNEMVIIFEAFLAGVLTLVFMVASNAYYWKKSLEEYSFEEVTAFIVLGLGIVMGLNEVYLQGMCVGSIICRIGILTAALLWGSGGGTMAGVMCGIIPAIGSNTFTHSLSLYAFSGLLAGLFKNMGRLGVIIGFMLGNLAVSLFVADISVIMTSMWETAIACTIFFILPASLNEKVPGKTPKLAGDFQKSGRETVKSLLPEDTQNNLEKLALIFSELSSAFYEKDSHDPQRMDTAYLNYIYAEICNRFCYHCSRYEVCWGQDYYATSQQVLDVFALAEQNGTINEKEPPELIRRCLYGKEMTHAINYMFDNVRTNEYWTQRLENTRQFVAGQLTGLSKIIKNLIVESDKRSYLDQDLKEKLLQDCHRLDLEIIDLFPVKSDDGQMYLKVVTPSCNGHTDCEREMAQLFSSITGDRLEVYKKKCPGITGWGNCEFTLTRAHNYRVETGAAQMGKETICGDSFTITALNKGQHLTALSDGMGVGEEACHQSRSAIKLLEKLLHCGYEKEMALETINSVLLLRSAAESFTTLDMLMIDLFTAEADFIKIASAPSFIKRGGDIELVNSNSLPIGVFKSLDMNKEKRILAAGDLVVMVSDGIVEAGRGKTDESWLIKYLQVLNIIDDPQLIAESIMEQALKFGPGKPTDDMTVIVVQIHYNDLNMKQEIKSIRESHMDAYG